MAHENYEDRSDYPEYAYDRALWHLNRAAYTEGATEAGLWRMAAVESAAAVVVALFAVADAISELKPD